MNNPPEPVLVVDTREQRSWEMWLSREAHRVTLETGDYSLLGCEDWICVERKSLDDLVGCLTHSRERFKRELRRASRIRDFYVIIEATYADLLGGKYQSDMSPKSAWESVIALQQRYNIPFLFAGGARVAARLCESILMRWWKEHLKVFDMAAKAQRTLATTGGLHSHKASESVF
jgi:DNA excision repair protein ERCC-4